MRWRASVAMLGIEVRQTLKPMLKGDCRVASNRNRHKILCTDRPYDARADLRSWRLLPLAVVWLVDRPTQTVLADVEPTSSSSPLAVPATAPSRLTPALKPTPVVTEAAVDPTPSRNFSVRQSVYNSEIRIVIVTE
jgi:hypothetical protein